MLLLLCSALVLTASAQDLDPGILEKVFGKPPSSTTSRNGATNNLEDITVKPTDSTATFQDGDGDACQCVPYYLCDAKLNAINLNDPTLTGFGELDIRFGEECQESIERCCKIPKIDKDVPPLDPDPKRLKGCGYRNVKGLDFTISETHNPNLAQFGEFPWVVALLDATNHSYYGVGVLIHPQVVMTGAHIAFKFAPGTIKIRAGEWDTQTSKERLQSQERIVDDIRVREDFLPKSLRNDMALLRLREPVQLADHINVICLPEQGELFDGYKNCVANGWGKDTFESIHRYRDNNNQSHQSTHKQKYDRSSEEYDEEDDYKEGDYQSGEERGDQSNESEEDDKSSEEEASEEDSSESNEEKENEHAIGVNRKGDMNKASNGNTKEGRKGRYAVILKKVEVDMVANPTCNQLLQNTRLGKRFKLHDSFVCAGGEAGKDTCQGDGGAPLACPIGNDRYKLSGLVAWGIGCGQQDVPAVYANVAYFRDWVDSIMAEWNFDTAGYKI